MATQEPIRVQIEGLDDLRRVVRDIHKAAMAMRDAAEEVRRSQRATKGIGRLVNDAALRSAAVGGGEGVAESRRLCDPEADR